MSKDAVKVRISDKDWNKLMTYLRLAKPDEVIGLAHAEIKDGAVLVYEPLILEQTVGPASCEIEPKALVKFIGDHERIDRVKVVWHSHVEMTAKFSSCDRDTSNTLAALGRMMSGPNSWWVSIVVNLKQEYECVVDMYTPFRATIPCEVFVFSETDPGMEEQVKSLLHRNSEKWKSGPAWPATGEYGDEFGHGMIEVRGGKRKDRSEKKTQEAHVHEDTRRYTEEDVFREIDLGGGGD